LSTMKSNAKKTATMLPRTARVWKRKAPDRRLFYF
jgi:hypothetical protein